MKKGNSEEEKEEKKEKEETIAAMAAITGLKKLTAIIREDNKRAQALFSAAIDNKLKALLIILATPNIEFTEKQGIVRAFVPGVQQSTSEELLIHSMDGAICHLEHTAIASLTGGIANARFEQINDNVWDKPSRKVFRIKKEEEKEKEKGKGKQGKKGKIELERGDR